MTADHLPLFHPAFPWPPWDPEPRCCPDRPQPWHRLARSRLVLRRRVATIFLLSVFQDKLNVKRCEGGVKLNVFSGFLMVREVGFEPTNPCGTGASGLRIQGLVSASLTWLGNSGHDRHRTGARLPRFQAPPARLSRVWEGPNLVFPMNLLDSVDLEFLGKTGVVT